MRLPDTERDRPLDDPHHDDRDEARTEEGRTDPARPGSLRDAIEHGYDPADAAEGCY